MTKRKVSESSYTGTYIQTHRKPTPAPCASHTRAFVLFISFTTLINIVGRTIANPDAKRLYDDLLSNYNRLIRPVGNNSDRLTVKMGLRLSQLIDVVSIF